MGAGPSAPVDHVVTQVPLEHEAPALDGAEQGLLEGAAVTLQPAVEDLRVLAAGHLLVQPLVGVDLETQTQVPSRSAWPWATCSFPWPAARAGAAHRGPGGFPASSSPGVLLAPVVYAQKGKCQQGVESGITSKTSGQERNEASRVTVVTGPPRAPFTLPLL